jgi:Ca-activated chloride channel family protein
MSDGGKMAYVREAVRLVARNLTPADRLSIVTYSDEAQVLLSGATLNDRMVIEHHLDMLEPMGSTNLSAGLAEGVSQVQSLLVASGVNRVILLSDGLANRGLTGRKELARYAAAAVERGISISTVGVGDDFDEPLLAALATAGQGNYYYVRDPEALPEILLQEMQGLAAVVAQNLTLTLDTRSGAEVGDTYGLHPERGEHGVRIRLGDIADGGRRLVGFTLRLPRAPAGERELATLTVTYDRLAGSIDRERASYPLRVEYTGDQRRVEAGRDPRVEHYLQVLATMDAMVLAMTSGNSKAMREVVDYLESDLDELRRWTRRVDDPEMTSVAQVFEECLTEFQRGGMRHGNRGARDPDAAKAVRYKLYRFHRGQPR